MEASLLVHRARVAGSAATRSDIERWLANVPVESLGLGADEMFYVPRLVLRVPEHGGIAPARMSDRILLALRQLLAGAECGWGTGFVPDRPYRFAGRARYTAWLIALWVKDGSASARAAFTAATGEASFARWYRKAVLPDGVLLVATVARLAEIGAAARWVARFEPGDVTVAFQAMEASFGLPLATTIETLSRREQSAEGVVPVAGSLSSPNPISVAQAVACLAERNGAWVSLSTSARILLLTALMVARAPAKMVSQPDAVAATIVDFAARLAGEPVVEHAGPIDIPHSKTGRKTASERPGPRPSKAGGSNGRSAQHPAEPSRTVTSLSQAQNIPPPASPRLEDEKPNLDTPLPSAPLSAQPFIGQSISTPFATSDARFTTAYGGLLFLVNAFTALGLYPDFTKPRGVRLAPSPLWLADRVGRYWFGNAYRQDPLSNWIAAHAEAGALPHAWQVRSEWLIGFETGAAPRRTHQGRRTTIWHPAGFPLFDGHTRDLPRSIGRARPALRAAARLPRADRWPACLALYLDARLQRIAGTGLALLVQPARIDIRDLDVRATFALDRHPVELRLAGLDRTPGWQPAEGRAFAFTFE